MILTKSPILSAIGGPLRRCTSAGCCPVACGPHEKRRDDRRGTAKEKKEERKKEKSNQWTEKSRNDGTNGADLFPRCLVSSDSVCSLSTLGQLHDFPLPQNAAKTTANTSQNSQTTYKLRNDVNPRSVRLPSAVSWLLLRSLWWNKRETLDVSHKSSECK